MSITNLISSLALIAQANQQIITESPLPSGKQYDIYKENNLKEIVLSLNADSVKDNLYLRISDWGIALGFDYKQDGKLDILIIYDGKNDTLLIYNNKKKKDLEIIKKGDARYDEIKKIIKTREESKKIR